MALSGTKDFVEVVVADQIAGTSNIVRFDVGDDIQGTDPVAIVGGKYKNNDPWILALKTRISSRRLF
jgi:hypothetical protein